MDVDPTNQRRPVDFPVLPRAAVLPAAGRCFFAGVARAGLGAVLAGGGDRFAPPRVGGAERAPRLRGPVTAFHSLSAAALAWAASASVASRATSILTLLTRPARAPAMASHGEAQARAAPPSTPIASGTSK